MTWIAVLAATAGCFALKLLGHSVPESILDRPFVRRSADLLPISLLSALVAVQTFVLSQQLGLDARVAGVCAAVIALLLRAPFFVVVLVAAATAASLRALGWAS